MTSKHYFPKVEVRIIARKFVLSLNITKEKQVFVAQEQL